MRQANHRVCYSWPGGLSVTCSLRYAGHRDILAEAKRFLAPRGICVGEIHPEAVHIVRREAVALGALHIEWLLRTILGKASDQPVTTDEATEFLLHARITPSLMLYEGLLRDTRFAKERLRKGVPSNGANLIFSPVIAEAMVDALVKRLISSHAWPMAGEPIVVVAKYLCGLVPGLLLALRLDLPYLVFSKRTLPFALPPDCTLVVVEEPHNPQGSAERYS